MKLSVRVKANSRIEKVEKVGENQFSVWLKSPAIEGRANAALIECLSRYFKVPKSRIVILRGLKNRNKLVEISE